MHALALTVAALLMSAGAAFANCGHLDTAGQTSKVVASDQSLPQTPIVKPSSGDKG